MRRIEIATRFCTLLLVLSFLAGCSHLPLPSTRHAEVQQSSVAQPSGSPEPELSPAARLIQQGELTRAEQLLVANRAQSTNDPAARTNLALVYLRTGRSREARELLEAVTQARPGYCPAEVALGLLYRQAFELEAARAAYERCLEVNASHHEALINLGILHELYLGDAELALSAYRRYQASRQEPDQEVDRWIATLVQAQPGQLAGAGR